MCTELGAECTIKACPSCPGDRPSIDECSTGRGYAQCGGDWPTPVFGCSATTRDCRWFEAGCVAQGYTRSDCDHNLLCCVSDAPFSDTQFPPDENYWLGRWLFGNGTEPWTREGDINVDVVIDPTLAAGTTQLQCSQAEPGDTPCDWPALDAALDGDTTTLALGARGLWGWYLPVEIDAGIDSARARACTFNYTDVANNECERVPTVRCATGTITVNKDPTVSTVGLVVDVDLTFPDGLRVTGQVSN